MAPYFTGRGWGWVVFFAAEAVSRFPGPPLEDPPTSPPRNSPGARGGSAVGRLAHGLPPPHGRRSVAADVPARLAQRLQRSRPNDTSSGGSAADVPQSAANGAAVEPLRALQRIRPSAARLRAWRMNGVTFGTCEHPAERPASRPDRQAGVGHAQHDGRRSPRSPGTGKGRSVCQPATPAWPCSRMK